MISALFLPNTPWLVTQSIGAHARVWDAALGKPLTPSLSVTSPGHNLLRLGLGGQKLLVFGESGKVRVFDLAILSDDNPHRISSEQLRLFAELQSIYTIHDGGGLVRLTTPEWLERWRRLRQERPDLLPWQGRN